MGYLDLSKQELEKEYSVLSKRFEEIKGMGLSLNMARGKQRTAGFFIAYA